MPEQKHLPWDIVILRILPDDWIWAVLDKIASISYLPLERETERRTYAIVRFVTIPATGPPEMSLRLLAPGDYGRPYLFEPVNVGPVSFHLFWVLYETLGIAGPWRDLSTVIDSLAHADFTMTFENERSTV